MSIVDVKVRQTRACRSGQQCNEFFFVHISKSGRSSVALVTIRRQVKKQEKVEVEHPRLSVKPRTRTYCAQIVNLCTLISRRTQLNLTSVDWLYGSSGEHGRQIPSPMLQTTIRSIFDNGEHERIDRRVVTALVDLQCSLNDDIVSSCFCNSGNT